MMLRGVHGRVSTSSPTTGSATRERSVDDVRTSVSHVRLSALAPDAAGSMFEQMGAVMAAAIACHQDAEQDGAENSSWAPRDWEQRRGAMLAEADAYVVHDGRRLVGFLAYRVVPLRGRPCVHLLAAYILPEFQGRGLGFALNARLVFRMLARRPGSAYFLAADVLNPIALAGWRDRITRSVDFYPPVGPGDRPRPELVSAAAAFAAERYPASQLDVATGVLRAKTLPRDRPASASGDREVDHLFDVAVDPRRGDTVLMLVDADRSMLLAELGQMARALPRVLTNRRRSREVHGER